MPESRPRVLDVPVRTRLLAVAGVGVIAVAALAALAGPWLGAGPAYPAKAAATFAAIAALAVRAVTLHHPFARMGPANRVTLLRALLVSLMAGLIGEPPAAAAAWFGIGVTTTAGLLDGVDGWLARRSRMSSAFGARLDMETDAFLILLLSALVWQHAKADAWVLVCGMMRYLFVAAGWIWPWLARPLAPTRRGKTVAVLQYILLGAALAPIIPFPPSALIAAASLAVLTWSFAIDVRRLHRQSVAGGEVSCPS